MHLEELQLKYDQLATYVKRYRSYQIKYEMYGELKDKNNMLRYQRLVDKAISSEGRQVEDTQIKLL